MNRSFSISMIIFVSTAHDASFLTLSFAAAVTGYQHPSESASGHASQFYIALLDSDNKEQRLDERGMTRNILNTIYIFGKLHVQFYCSCYFLMRLKHVNLCFIPQFNKVW